MVVDSPHNEMAATLRSVLTLLGQLRDEGSRRDFEPLDEALHRVNLVLDEMEIWDSLYLLEKEANGD